MSTESSAPPAPPVNGSLDARTADSWSERSARLHGEFRRPCANLVRRAFGSAFADDEIEDIYSDAWLGTYRALQSRHAELTDDEIRSYMFTAVANHASKRIRTRKRRPTAPLEAAGAVADVSRPPDEEVAGLEQSRVTRDLLASLPPRRRAVMLMRYGWGLEPKQVCGLIDGLSPRAYRKEITRGVEELIGKLKLVDSGEWCNDRLDVLKVYASGLADEDQTRQAEQHMSHCRHCHELVGRIHEGLNSIGPIAGLPFALESIGRSPTLAERAGEAFDRARDSLASLGDRADRAADAVQASTGARGAGAAGSGVLAKLAGVGTGAKVVAACVGGGVAATACVAAGVGPAVLIDSSPSDRGPSAFVREADIPTPEAPPPVVEEPAASEEPAVSQPEPKQDESADTPETESESPLAADTPPEEQEFGVAAAAVAVGSGGGGGGSSGGSSEGSAVGQEFGP